MVTWTEADLAAHLARKAAKTGVAALRHERKTKAVAKALRPVKEPLSACWLKLLAMPGVTEKPTPGTMNKWEEQHAGMLWIRVMAQDVSGYHFERFRFKIGKKCLYIPDFVLLENDGSFSVDEVKGFRRDDAMVKIKVAALMYPQITFRLWEQKRGAWKMTEVER